MCGIIGVVGDGAALPVLLDGLRRLEYRGYDSSGVAILQDGGVDVVRKAGKLQALETELDGASPAGTTGIGHTRWATHGGPTDANAHPHRDCTGRVALIHNGIIENFLELRARLTAQGHTFASETDTEALAHLVEAHYDGDLVAAVRAMLREVDGAFSLAVVCADEPGLIVAAKRTNPLIVGSSADGTFLASDPTALLPYTRDMVHVLDDQLVEIRRSGFTLTSLDGEPAEGTPIRVDWDLGAAEKSGYDTFMLKEMYEQPAAIADALRGRTLPDGSLHLDEITFDERVLRDVTKVFVVACGSAYHAGLVAKYAIEHWTRLPVEIDIASEFRYREAVLGPDTLCVVISQSGETIDTLEALRHAREQHARIVSVVNVVGSSVARESDAVLYLRAGPEIAVCSTKAFTAQVVGMKLLALYLAQVRGTMYPAEIAAVVDDLHRLPELIARTLLLHDEVREIAKEIVDARSALFIGRHVGYPAALEGALKLKEISYLHAEGFAAGEMKHGPIALLEPGVPVVAVATRCHVYQKVLSNIQEAKARGAFVIAICSEGDREEVARHADRVLEVPAVHELLVPALVTVPMQFLAYEVALLRGCDIDQPRNLAKSVTVGVNPLLRAADVRAQDAAAGDVAALMERAGYAVASAARAMLGRTYGARIVVACGRGNNGGDGREAARVLASWGAHVQVVPVGEGLALSRADLAIDALLGVGLSRAPDGFFAEAIAALNAFEGPVLSVDVPSGVDGDTGEVPGVAVRADVTVTFTGLKPGLLFAPGNAYAGRVTVASIGLPADAGSAWSLTRDEVARLLPVRAPDAHKGSGGRVLLVAGSVAMPGAAALATLACVRAGAGLTTLAAPDEVCRVVAGHVAEATTIPLPSSDGVFDLKGLEALRPRLADARALVIGPGLGRHPATADAVRALIADAQIPVVIDADGLDALQGHLELPRQRSAPTVLTPHQGEFTRLFGEVTDRLFDADTAASRTGAVVVLKGPGTVSGGARTYVNPTGDASLAQGGSGDVLAGLIGAFLAQSPDRDVADVVASAVWIHGRAAERLSAKCHPQPATASDLAGEIGRAEHEVLHG